MESAQTNTADIIISAHNRFPGTRSLLEGIYRYTNHPFHIYVVDSVSTDETVDLHRIYTRDITVHRSREHLSRYGAINSGIGLGSNPYIVFIEQGVVVSRGWLGNMVSFLDSHPRIGAVGPLNSRPDGAQSVDFVRERVAPQIPQFLTEDPHERNKILQYHFPRTGVLIARPLDFCCAVVKRRVVQEIGLFDETSPIGADSDYCQRLRGSGYVLGLSLDTYVLIHPETGLNGACEEAEGGQEQGSGHIRFRRKRLRRN